MDPDYNGKVLLKKKKTKKQLKTAALKERGKI